MPRRVHVVAHTHWDREWYLPFPVFRMRLVELVGVVLDALEDGRLPHFQLDGQAAVLDDHLAIRPGDEERIRALVTAGRLSVGPWYTLPDEFLVSGETLVRNLRLGRRTARRFGASMPVGYLPDMFGHVAQMPQILRGFGLADAVVWRGVPAAVDAASFRWSSPDGSWVRTEYLPGGYGAGARRVADAAALAAEVDAHVARWGELAGDPVLWPAGTDHLLPDLDLPDVLAAAAADPAIAERYTCTTTTLEDHLASRPAEPACAWTGELRSGARADVLRNVASTRLDVKAACARAATAIERMAEPLSALWLPAEDWPGAFLDDAWLAVIRNAAHDSICGCSADEVNDAVLHRYAEATRTAEALAERALIRVLGASGEAAVAVNPTARPRSGTTTLILPGEQAPPDTQQVDVHPAREVIGTVPWSAAVSMLLHLVGDDPKVRGVTIAPGAADGPAVVEILVGHGPGRPRPDELLRTLREAAAPDPAAPVRVVRVRRGPTQEVLARIPEVPGFGWRGLAPAPLGDHAVRALEGGLTNGLVTVVPDQGDGTIAIDGVAGFLRLVDEGDGGDTYTWSPLAGDRPVERPDDVDVLVAEAGPVRGRIEITRTYRWPHHVADGERRGSVPVTVRTTVELHAGEDLVRVSVAFDNPARDHRLRVLLPLPRSASTSVAGCAFATVERGLETEGGPDEAALPTFPSQRFVTAGGLTVAHEGLPEYELVDIAEGPDGPAAGALALTILRSVGTLALGPLAGRTRRAGPDLPTPDAQLLGPRTARFVLHLGGRDPHAVADEAFTPLLTTRFPGRGGIGDPDRSASALTVDGGEVTALTRRADGRLELRLVNPTAEPATITVPGRRGERTDLEGTPIGVTIDGTVALGPWEIATIALDEP